VDGVDVALWIAAAALTGVSTWLTLPRPAALDWELFFKLALVTALRGDVEREGGDAERWVKLARSRIWYHPGGRDLERKVLEPAGYEPEIPARQGERGLLEALVRLPDPAARLALLLGEERGDEVLFDDPAALGGEYDLERALGPGASWNGLAARNPDLDGALRRRNAHNVWVVLGHPALAGALAEILGEGSVAALEVGDAEALAIALDERLSAPSIRLVLVAAGSRQGGGRGGAGSLRARGLARRELHPRAAGHGDLQGGALPAPGLRGARGAAPRGARRAPERQPLPQRARAADRAGGH
jgi:hypothetical protein